MKMYLTRDVRFAVNPFSSAQIQGHNPYACKPSGTGLTLYLELSVALHGELDVDTGFVVNVCDIDQCVRENIVPVFVDRICNLYARQKDLSISDLAQLLYISKSILALSFGLEQLGAFTLKLNPYRKIALSGTEDTMIYFSEKFEFAAMHKLWNVSFGAEKNMALFGKCANPSGHGHNYIIEVTLKTKDASAIDSLHYESMVDTHLINILDHKNLNIDVPYFRQHNPTMENIARFAWEQLAPNLGHDLLHCVTVWESDRTQCSFYGP